MSTSCREIATATRTDVTATFTERTTFTTITTTLPGQVSTSVFSTCLFHTGTSTCVPFVSTDFITGTGTPTVTQVPFTEIADIELTITTTLFGSTCTTINKGVQDASTSSISVSKTSSAVHSTTPTSSSTLNPSSSAAPALNTATSGNKFPVAAVAGGAAGGIVLLAALAWFAWKFFNKPKQLNFAGNGGGPHQFAGNQFFEKPESGFVHPTLQFNSPQNPTQCNPQNSANNSNAQQNQSQNQNQNQDQTQNQQGQGDNPWDHRPHRLPKPVEDKLKEKIDQYVMPTPAHPMPHPAAGPRPTSGYQQHNNVHYTPPPNNNIVYSTSPPGVSPMPSPGNPYAPGPAQGAPGPYNTSVSPQGQTAYPQSSMYPPQTAASTQYKGYAEPSSTGN